MVEIRAAMKAENSAIHELFSEFPNSVVFFGEIFRWMHCEVLNVRTWSYKVTIVSL